MSQALFLQASDILSQRILWEQKQRTFAVMVNAGLPRLNKPFPTASDGHVSVIDKAIRKARPFWMGQIMGGERLCSFTSLQEQPEGFTDAAADYYDFQTRNHSQLIYASRVAVYYMLRMGRGIIKSTCDPMNKYNVIDEARNPYMVLMPQGCNDFDDAQEFVDVRTVSVAEYEHYDNRWNKDPKLIAKIRGNENYQSIGLYQQQKQLREGITYTSDESKIIFFEHWTKTGGGWTINTYSPMYPLEPLRKAYGCIYKVGDKVSCPFFSFQMEITEEGWYSPRGLAELLASWEQYQTKLLNEKADAITFANRPLYTGEKEILNMANYRWQPGEYIPGNIRGVQQGVPPISFDQEISYAKQEAEEISRSPDFGIQGQGPQSGKARTATENERIAALQQAGVVDDGQMFRDAFTKLHKHRWGMMVQFKEREFSYYAAGQCSVLPEQALHSSYMITPDGSPDAWNPQARFQKYLMAMQAFQGNPFVNMEVLTKAALNAFDGRVALKAFVPQDQQGADEYRQQIIEINSLLAPAPGRPAFPDPVKPSQNQVVRIKAIMDWMHAAGVMGTPVDPMAKQRLQQNLAMRLEMLKKQNPAAAKQVQAMIQQMEQPQQASPQAPMGQQQIQQRTPQTV